MSLILDGGNGITFPSGSGTQAAQSKVLQVVSVTNTSNTSTTSTSFVASNLTASITPLFSTSKIFIIVNSIGSISSTSYVALYTIYRNSTNLSSSAGFTFAGVPQDGTVSMSYLDSPTTTSATSYTAYFRTSNSSGTAYFADTASGVGQTSTITLLEIAQ